LFLSQPDAPKEHPQNAVSSFDRSILMMSFCSNDTKLTTNGGAERFELGLVIFRISSYPFWRTAR
jgi:hypothetical protein